MIIIAIAILGSPFRRCRGAFQKVSPNLSEAVDESFTRFNWPPATGPTVGGENLIATATAADPRGPRASF